MNSTLRLLLWTIDDPNMLAAAAMAGPPYVKAAVAASAFLPASLANDLATTRSGHLSLAISQSALRRADDPDVLTWAYRSGTRRRQVVLANENCPVELLVEAAEAELGYGSAPVRLAVASNPSTPLPTRRALVTDPALTHHVNKCNSTTTALLLSARLADTNSWMAESPDMWSTRMARGLAQRADLDVDTMRLLARKARLGDEFRATHPSALRADPALPNPDTASVSTLVEFTNSALDWFCVRSRHMTLDELATVVHPGRFHLDGPDPHVVVDTVERFGTRPFLARDRMPGERSRYAHSRIAACRRETGLMDAAWLLSARMLDDVDSTVEVLDDDPDSWRMLFHLLNRSSPSLTEVAKAVRRLRTAA